MTMIPTELRLAGLRHCFVHLPQSFLSRGPNLELGAIIYLRAIQSDKELFVTWDGQITGGEHVELDLTFARANGFNDEFVIVSVVDRHNCSRSSLCRAELLDSADYSILSQHHDVRLLDTCQLVYKDLTVPIWVSRGVHVLVKISSIEPFADLSILTGSTEMQFLHSSDEKTTLNPDESAEVDEIAIERPIPLISCSFSESKPKFHLGSLLVTGERGLGKTYFLKDTLERYKKYNGTFFNCKQLRGKRPEAIKKKLTELLDETLEKQPSILCLDDIDSFVKSDPKHEDETGQEAVYNKRLVAIFCDLFKQIERSSHKKGRNIVVMASCGSLDALDERISKPAGRNFFLEIIKLVNPDLQQRMTMLKSITSQHKQVEHSIDDGQFEILAKKCNSFTPFDLKQLVERSIINACSRSLDRFNTNLLEITFEDFVQSLDGYVPLNLRGVSLKPRTDRSFDDIGGMAVIKDIIRKTILVPLKYPKLYGKCPIKRMTSILLYGPPGCGKTLIAEALTNVESINSISVKGPELLSKYIGASESSVRDLFRRAELAKPCVIFFDEFESLVSKRGSDSSGVTDRVVNQFLTMLDGVDRLSSSVFIVAATSRPDLIDPAMLRPGRLDRHVYCPLPDQSDRHDILRVLMRHIDFEDSDVTDIQSYWAERLVGFTGADIRSFLYSSQLKALHDLIGLSSPENCTPSLMSSSRGRSLLSGQIIKVKRHHLEESFDEMLPEISTRHENILKNYPKSMRKLNQQQISTRATLA